MKPSRVRANAAIRSCSTASSSSTPVGVALGDSGILLSLRHNSASDPTLDDAELHVAWNQAIAQLVVLPGVLPALSEYVNKNGLSDAEIEENHRLDRPFGVDRSWWSSQ
jgi:hypothetical protein